eukprot:IDg14104t1
MCARAPLECSAVVHVVSQRRRVGISGQARLLQCVSSEVSCALVVCKQACDQMLDGYVCWGESIGRKPEVALEYTALYLFTESPV